MPTYETPSPISALIELALGSVRITAAEPGATTVDVRPSDAANSEDVSAADATRVECTNDALLVRAPRLRSWLSRTGGGSIDVDIALPADSSLNLTGASADFLARGRLGDCRIKTGLGHIRIDEGATLSLHSGTGDVSVERATGAVEVSAGSGEVRLRAVDGGAIVKNSNGDTWVGASGGDLRLRAANGSIAVGVARADVAAKSANGDIRLDLVERGSVVAETKIGEVEVGVRDGVAAWLDLNASAGRVENALEASEAPAPSAQTVEIRARTSVGAVVVRKAS
jgi:DUF4097 and DUF4098 domain-containing protein YvlB